MSNDHVPPSPRCRADLAAARRAEKSCSSKVWAQKSEAAVQAKEEAIRHAINTVSLTSVFKSPMALAETERQKTIRRQERFVELYRAANDHLQRGSSSDTVESSPWQRAATRGSLGNGRGTAAAAAADTVGAATEAQQQRQADPLLLHSSRRTHCDGEPAASGASISRPNTARIPSAASCVGGLRTGWFRGGGGPTSFAAVAQTSRFATTLQNNNKRSGGGSGCNGAYRSSSALDNSDIPLYSSFSADGVFHPNAKDDVQQLVTQFWRSASAASSSAAAVHRRPVSASPCVHSSAVNIASATHPAPQQQAPQDCCSAKVPPPSVAEAIRLEQREALQELRLLEEALGQPGSDARRLFWKRTATPAVATAAAAADHQQRKPLAASPPPRSLYGCPADPLSGAGMYLPARPTSAPYQVAFRSNAAGGAHQHHLASKRGFGAGTASSVGGGSCASPGAGTQSPDGSPLNKSLADEADSSNGATPSSRGAVPPPGKRPSVFSALVERLKVVPPNVASSTCDTRTARDDVADDEVEEEALLIPPEAQDEQEQELVSSPSPCYSGVYNRSTLFRPRQSLVRANDRDGSSGTFVTSLDDALRCAAR